MRNQTFGTEIELTGATRRTVAKAIAEYFGTSATYEGGAYRELHVKDNKGRTWKVERDASIKPQEKDGAGRKISASDEYKVEIVTPILYYDDIETLQEVVRTVRKAGAFPNSSCGMHVHVGADGFTPQTLRNIVNIIASKEDLLYKALKVNQSREGYCRKTNENLLRVINERKPRTMAELKRIWYESQGCTYGMNQHYNDSRYHDLNLHATFTKGTVEFRLFNSTLHAGEVKANIQFCLAVAYKAKTTKKAIYRRTVTDNEKYAFRCWMLRLGLIGDEFKTCRFHFLKNLAGNSAWRHGIQ